MPESALQAAGAQIDPSAAAPLHTNEWFTGLLTQGNPLGPGPVPYLQQKYYSANRYDRLLGGSNTEISMKATLGRRLGHSVYNGALASAASRLYLFRALNTNGADNRLLADLAASVNDVTAGNNSVLFNKASGAGKACFQGVGNTCYIGDGVDQKKYMQAGKVWQANTVYTFGDIVADSHGNLQVVESMLTLSIAAVEVFQSGGSPYAMVTFNQPHKWAVGTNITFNGLQRYTGLNGLAIATSPYPILNDNQIVVPLPGVAPNYGPSSDVGTATSQPGATQGKSGNTPPIFSTTIGNYTADGNLEWRCFGQPIFEWGCAPAANPPSIVVNVANHSWQPNLTLSNAGPGFFFYPILDPNNQIQVIFIGLPGSVQTGPSQPIWSQIAPSATQSPGITSDGSANWICCGPIAAWVPNFTMGEWQCIRDGNGNLQIATTIIAPGQTGAALPVWATGLFATTHDNNVTWTNVGPADVLFTATRKYSVSYHTISGQVTTVSGSIDLNPNGPVLGRQGNGVQYSTLSGPIPAQVDIDQIWIWATEQGGALPLLLGKIPNPTPGVAGAWTFYDSLPDAIINLFIAGPQANANDPPPTGFLPLGFHLGLLCGAIGNQLYYSNGTTAVGNPNESYPPNNRFQLPSAAVGGWSTAIGLVVLRVDGISIMLGSNRSNDPLYVVNIFDNVGLASRDGFTTRGSELFMMTTTGKLLKLGTSQFVSAIGGGIAQALPDDEIGFPIGDLLGQFTPANCSVAWLEGPSSDSGLFVCDGSTGWYMMRMLALPDQAIPWSPKATISIGVTTVYSAQTAPGINSLLVCTPTGPILKRDSSTNADAGVAFTANALIAPLVLAEPGKQVEVEFVTIEEKKLTGATAASVGVLFDEISGTMIPLVNQSNDPPNLPPSATIATQRLWTEQGGLIPIGRYMLQQVSWPAEDYANELLTNTIYGRLPATTRR